MGGRSQTLGALWLLLLLQGGKNFAEIAKEEWKDLSHAITALLNLRGLPDRMTHRSLLPAFQNTSQVKSKFIYIAHFKTTVVDQSAVHKYNIKNKTKNKKAYYWILATTMNKIK
ncbi:unnamed protein product [Boreogadus saida]